MLRGARGAAKSDAVTVVQRTESNLRLNPHLHVLFLDGTYHEDGAELAWNELGHPQTRQVGQVLEDAVGRRMRHLRRQVYRWTSRGYLLALTAERGERVRAESFGEVELEIDALFGDDEG